MMKWIVCMIGWLCWLGKAAAQVTPGTRVIAVTTNKTSNLVFPAAISSVDRGSERIVVQKAMAHILRVKADTVFADTTNLTIITSDGKLYSFLVYYSPSPNLLTIDLAGAGNVTVDTLVIRTEQQVFDRKPNLHGIGTRASKVQWSLIGLYTTGEWVVCKFRITNHSSLSYVMGGIRFYSRDAHAGKRRSTQDREVVPIHVSLPVVVRENSSQLLLVTLPKPSLAFSKRLMIDLLEKEGERNLSLHISNRYLLGAEKIINNLL